MNSKLFLGILLVTVLAFAGCIDKTPTTDELRNIQLVDSFCKSKGYEYGANEELRKQELWNIIDDFNGKITVVTKGENGIVCFRTKKEYSGYYPSDFKDYVDKVIYINETK